MPQAYVAYPVHRRRSATAVAAPPSLAGRAYHALLRATGTKRRRERLEEFRLERADGARLLELGCGNGDRLRALQQKGYRVEGQDVAPAAVSAAAGPGITVHHGELHNLGLEAASFDVIAMNHVLEHVPDPRPFLREVRQLLAPGGFLVSVQPNGASRAHRRFGPDWVGLDPPRHLHVYSPASLRMVLRDAGFRDVRVHSTVLRAEHWERDSLRRQAARTGRLVGGMERRSALAQLKAALAAPFSPLAGDETVAEARP